MSWLVLLSVLPALVSTHAGTPFVLWHGLGDTCCNPYSVGGFAAFLEKELNGTKVLSLKIGSNFADEVRNSYMMNSNDQVHEACKIIQGDPDLKDGYHAIGFSQGGQFLRAVAQRCPNPPMKILVSLGAQHQGIYGLPHCPGQKSFLCEYARKILDYGAYWSITQKELVPAQYWHDPLDESTYREKSIFLADINNEKALNQQYKDHLSRLEKLILVKFGADSIVQPRESSWFGKELLTDFDVREFLPEDEFLLVWMIVHCFYSSWYKRGQDVEVDKMEDTALYSEDRIGLKTLNEAGKLILVDIPGAEHLQFSEQWFKENIIKKYF